MIPFNKPSFTGKEIDFINDVIARGNFHGDGYYTANCHDYFKCRFNIPGGLLTTSCTDALEMAAILLNIKHGDEVILPSYTFVSTALAFYRQGAVLRFIDSRPDNPCMDESAIEELINPKTKAIVPVHYSGIACDMYKIRDIAAKYRLFVVEDAAHAIADYYYGIPLGTIGDLGCFSFHSSKAIHCGEGGFLIINNENFLKRAEIIWEKGTNKLQFKRGETDYYEWCDTGSSFLPSELNAAFLKAQLDDFARIISKRKRIWDLYDSEIKILNEKGHIRLPNIPDYATQNGHSYFFMMNDKKQLFNFLNFMKNSGIECFSHYFPLHKSKFYSRLHDGRQLRNSIMYANTLVRLPLYEALEEKQVFYITDHVKKFFKK